MWRILGTSTLLVSTRKPKVDFDLLNKLFRDDNPRNFLHDLCPVWFKWSLTWHLLWFTYIWTNTLKLVVYLHCICWMLIPKKARCTRFGVREKDRLTPHVRACLGEGGCSRNLEVMVTSLGFTSLNPSLCVWNGYFLPMDMVR